jgi:hypothetical protein
MEETRGYYQGLANRIRIDMDSRSPRLRLSVIGYLVDGGITPKSVGSASEWLEFIEKTVTFVGADLVEFVDDIAEFELPEKSEHGEADIVGAPGDDVLKGSKGYL